MTTTVKGLREQRMKIATEMRSLVEEAAKRDNPGLTAEESAKFDEMEKREVELRNLADKLEKTQQAEATRDELREIDARHEFRPNPKTADENAITQRDRDIALRSWLLRGKADPKWNDIAAKVGMDMRSNEYSAVSLLDRAPRDTRHLKEIWAERYETRAGTTTAQSITTTAGGHTVQNEMMREIEIALLQYGGVRNSGAEVIRTQTGATLPIPTVNDTTNKSSIISINTAIDTEALVFGQVTMSAYMYTTNMILVPIQLMQDTAIDLMGLIGRALGERAGRGTNNHFTVGVTSDTQPAGIVTEAIQGSTGSDVNTVTYAQLVTLMHSVDPAYRMSPSCGWMFNDNTLSVLKKLTSTDGRPLWLPGLSGLAGDFPDTLLGKRYTINQDMASIATATTGAGAAKAILFGAFDRYKIRDVMDFTLVRLNERYAEKGQTAFFAWHRHDGKTVVATTVTPPIKYYVTKST